MLAAGPSAAGARPAPNNIDQPLWAELVDGSTTQFWVYLDARADLSRTPATSRTDAARWVYERLTAAAEESQQGLRAWLRARGVDHQAFWLSNAIHVTGDLVLAEQLAARPDVSHLADDEPYRLLRPTERAAATSSEATVEWGIANIQADAVWSDLEVDGEEIVVASVDTGVRFTHGALVGQYRGNLGGGQFDHNYNWFDPTGVCGDSPCDNNNHGSHVTGTMVGDDGAGNQIGVAPGAKWIAAKGCASSSCSQSDLLAAAQWMVAPTDLNGQNADPSRAPHVVNNSWGGGRGDTWYQDAINGWVNAGIFPMFAIGNTGPSCNTASSPGDNLPAYGVGAYSINNTIAGFSGRGYSGVDGSTIKPDISAPGVSVRSATADSDTSYANFSGTSMATPHAAGVVALMWSVAPDLVRDVPATKAVLDSSARSTSDLACGGTADDNNVFGQGRLDAYAAVVTARDGAPPPTAAFTVDCGADSLTCTFDGTDATSPTGDVVSWQWWFGDGGTGSGEDVTHTYAVAGVYDVALRVTDETGRTGRQTQRIVAGPRQPPVAAFTDNCSQTSDLMFCFLDGRSSSSESGEIVAWEWDLGDGAAAAGAVVFHAYSIPGAYEVTLTVTDGAGLTGSVTRTVGVVDH
jgi:subtilisin family serine protease